MLYTVTNFDSGASTSAILSQLFYAADVPAIHWTPAPHLLPYSAEPNQPQIFVVDQLARSLTPNEEQLVWSALLASSEPLYQF